MPSNVMFLGESSCIHGQTTGHGTFWKYSLFSLLERNIESDKTFGEGQNMIVMQREKTHTTNDYHTYWWFVTHAGASHFPPVQP